MLRVIRDQLEWERKGTLRASSPGVGSGKGREGREEGKGRAETKGTNIDREGKKGRDG
jgi:hypothetical protein